MPISHTACAPSLTPQVYDYYVDEAQCLMVSWEDKVPKFSYIPGEFSSVFVSTVETTRLTYFLDSLVANKHHVMFVGNTGTGKVRSSVATSVVVA